MLRISPDALTYGGCPFGILTSDIALSTAHQLRRVWSDGRPLFLRWAQAYKLAKISLGGAPQILDRVYAPARFQFRLAKINRVLNSLWDGTDWCKEYVSASNRTAKWDAMVLQQHVGGRGVMNVYISRHTSCDFVTTPWMLAPGMAHKQVCLGSQASSICVHVPVIPVESLQIGSVHCLVILHCMSIFGVCLQLSPSSIAYLIRII